MICEVSPVLRHHVEHTDAIQIEFEAEATTFEMFVGWCYSNSIECDDIPSQNVYEPLFGLYKMALELGVPKLMNAVVKKMCILGTRSGRPISPLVVQRIYRELPTAIPLRGFARDQWLFRVPSSVLKWQSHKKLDHRFTFDLLKKSFAELEKNPSEPIANPEESPEDYFVSEDESFPYFIPSGADDVIILD
jgi:hypothetical protein